jgi:ribosome-associated protein
MRACGGLNPPRGEDTITSQDKATDLANAIIEKKAQEVVLLDVTNLVDYVDCFLLATGTSSPHLDAMTDEVQRVAKALGLELLGVEGRGSGTWVLLDYGDLLIHLFSSEGRGFYDLDGLWCDAERTELTDDCSAFATA